MCFVFVYISLCFTDCVAPKLGSAVRYLCCVYFFLGCLTRCVLPGRMCDLVTVMCCVGFYSPSCLCACSFPVVTTSLENPEMSGNLTVDREMSGILS